VVRSRSLRKRGKMLEHLVNYFTLGSVCVAALAAYIAVRNNSRQLGAQIFLAYSNRVREIRESIARNAEDFEANLAATFLIFELFELRQRGYVENRIWTIWDQDISELLRRECFRAHWPKIKPRLLHHAHFVNWVSAQLSGSAPAFKATGAQQ
jgi:hypothetical protein